MTEDITWGSSTDSERRLSKPTRTTESLPRMDPQKQSKHCGREESLEEGRRKTREQEDSGKEGNSKTEPKSEWDEFEDEVEDPFQKPSSPKERKLAARDQALRAAERPIQPPRESDAMDSTTGRRLIQSDVKFEIDISEHETNKGGMVISGGPVLDSILEDLEDELLSSDMGHEASSELIDSLRAHLIGSRVGRGAPLDEVVERALQRRHLVSAQDPDIGTSTRPSEI